jgi:hypothetical protein
MFLFRAMQAPISSCSLPFSQLEVPLVNLTAFLSPKVYGSGWLTVPDSGTPLYWNVVCHSLKSRTPSLPISIVSNMSLRTRWTGFDIFPCEQAQRLATRDSNSLNVRNPFFYIPNILNASAELVICNCMFSFISTKRPLALCSIRFSLAGML